MDVASLVHGLDARDELVGDQEDGLQGELLAAVAEKVLERGTEKLDSHDVILAFAAIPEELRVARFSSELLEHLRLLNHLWPSDL